MKTKVLNACDTSERPGTYSFAADGIDVHCHCGWRGNQIEMIHEHWTDGNESWMVFCPSCIRYLICYGYGPLLAQRSRQDIRSSADASGV